MKWTKDATRSGAKVLVTGATGYIGGRLVPRLLDAGYHVVCLSRSARKLRARPWSRRDGLTVQEGNVSDPLTLHRVMRECRVAYYLVHSMETAGRSYAKVDRRLAQTFARAAEHAGVERIVYLGGLGETGADLSEHLSSRREVESALASTSVPVTTLRAAMIIGSGSASFETLRYLVERLPVMVTPKWVRTECQPIAVRDVLFLLVEVLRIPETKGRTFDIGGADVLSYRDILQTTADVLGLPNRIIIPVPVLTPRLSSAWIHLVTPISHRIARPLAEGLRNRVVCRNDEIRRLTGHRFLGVRESIAAAIESVEANRVQTAWSDAGVLPGDPDWAGGTAFSDQRTTRVDAPATTTFEAICRIGGANGYYAADGLWTVRGIMDRLMGGPGLRRGRRHPEKVDYGDAIDFWRVTDVVPDRRLQLRAEMKLPGEATLDLTVEPLGPGASRLTQTARFRSRGLLGILYWYAVLPLHRFVFAGMLRGIRRAAEDGVPRRVACTSGPGAIVDGDGS
ncbi:MAG TPA: SDR family oxidoreductase [Vicinamibacteria bacterium]|nr:SDR family oxidoreductase [Vicinamibacteria bacterium]